MDQKKTTIKTNIAKKTPLQTMEDKLRVANNVNKKYESLLNDLEKDYKEACNELGPEEVAALLEKKPEQKTNAVVDTRKDGKLIFLRLTTSSNTKNCLLNVVVIKLELLYSSTCVLCHRCE